VEKKRRLQDFESVT